MTMSVQIIGILNVTPDSYFDGGKYANDEAILAQAESMIADGADWIEVGGESTGPGSPEVALDEELKRTIPAIESIKKKFPNAKIAIDTWKSPVAKAALDAGATLINDVTAGRSDPNMFGVVAKANCLYAMMFAKDATPRTTKSDATYADVVATVKTFLKERLEAAEAAGINRANVILDPGMGHFVSSLPDPSLELIARLEEFADLGCPLLLSPSRKSFLAGDEKLPPSDRLPGTIAASAIAAFNGAAFIRTHDVQETRRGCEIAARMREVK